MAPTDISFADGSKRETSSSFGDFDRSNCCLRREDCRGEGISTAHLIFYRMPELFRLADGRATPQLPQSRAAWTHHSSPKLHRRRAATVPRDGSRAHHDGPVDEPPPENWRLVEN